MLLRISPVQLQGQSLVFIIVQQNGSFWHFRWKGQGRVVAIRRGFRVRPVVGWHLVVGVNVRHRQGVVVVAAVVVCSMYYNT
jgi:hypothetical protein